MNGPKNSDLYLEVEKMIFMSSVQYAVVMCSLSTHYSSEHNKFFLDSNVLLEGSL